MAGKCRAVYRENVTAADALKESNNAVAVKVLKDYGVEKSVRFWKIRSVMMWIMRKRF